ncbi:MAG: carbohydrate porin [Nitrospiraceae bacterium]|nr:MAG: carbohydrate porin [Nitrospiraceae bacterium]
MKKILLSMLFIVTIFAFTSLSHASGVEAVLKMMLKKGMITEADYDEVMDEMKGPDSLEQRVQSVEQKTADLGRKQAVVAKQNESFTEHVDKHIIHEEGAAGGLGNLAIGGGITMVGQGTSGNDGNATGEDVVDGNVSVDLEISAALGEHGEGFIALEAISGDGLPGDELETFWGVNADAGDNGSSLEVIEAWYEHRFGNDAVTVTAGKLDLTNYFDGNKIANDETTQFLADGFINNLSIEFPDNGFGVRLTATPSEIIDITLGFQEGDADWEDIFEDPFLIGEVVVKPQIAGRQGNYRASVWTNRTPHTKILNTGDTNEHNSGVGISVDQQLIDDLSVFGRLGFQNADVSLFDLAWSGGIQVEGSLWGREGDVFAIAYGEARLSDDYEADRRANSLMPADEGHFEFYYSLVVNEHVVISPDIQIITNAMGDDNFETVVVGAVRGQVTF